MVLDAALLSTQHYKVMIKGKVEHLSVVAIEKGAFRSPLTKVTNLYLLLIIYLHSVKWFQVTI